MVAQSLSKAERLAIAGQTAPALRSAKRPRSVKVVDADGKVVRTIDSLELAKKVHERAGIEFDVADGEKKTHSVCRSCGAWFSRGRPRRGQPWRMCVACRSSSRQQECAGWSGPCPHKAKPTIKAFDSKSIARRRGQPWRCDSCHRRRAGDLTSRSSSSQAARFVRHDKCQRGHSMVGENLIIRHRKRIDGTTKVERGCRACKRSRDESRERAERKS